MRKQLITLIVVLAGAMAVSCVARAAGEAKDQSPFTTPATGVQSQIHGEAKNQTPFTALMGTQAESQGEAKNELPFTSRPSVSPDAFERYAAAHPYGRGLATTVAVSKSDSGFDWRYVVVGVSACAALLIIGTAVYQSRRRPDTTAVIDV
jgi:hypothetical protein